MAEPNVLKLAKQGNPKAIAAMINRSLRAKHIVAKVNRQDDCLQVLVESAQVPNQKAMISFIRQGLTKLGIEAIKTVQVYGRQKGQDSFAWNQSFEIESSPPQVADVHDSDPDLNLHQTSPNVAAGNETSSRSPSPELEPPPGSNFATVPRHAPTGGYTPSQNRQPSDSTPHRSTQPRHSQPRQPLKPLSVGNVVSAGLRLYRDHFKLYLGIAFRACLWALLPIYGWAKFSANSALISRLAFRELSERPETVTQARRHINPRMWSFFFAGILVILIFLGAMIGFSVLFGIVASVLPIQAMVMGFLFNPDPVKIGIFLLLALVIGIALMFGYIWLYSRLSIVELPLAIENNVDATSTIGRSWLLTKGFVLRLVGIFFVAYIITIPIAAIVQVVSWIVQVVFAAILSDSGFFGLLYFLLNLALFLGGLAFPIPFWQAIKAVIYYDLRSRREGMDLQLGNSLNRFQ